MNKNPALFKAIHDEDFKEIAKILTSGIEIDLIYIHRIISMCLYDYSFAILERDEGKYSSTIDNMMEIFPLLRDITPVKEVTELCYTIMHAVNLELDFAKKIIDLHEAEKSPTNSTLH